MKAFNFATRQSATDANITVFELRGYIDAHTVIEFEKAVNGVMESGARAVVLDIGGLSYISSAGIGAMMGLARKLSQLGGDLVLMNPTQKVFSILEGLGFTKIFKIAETEDLAVEKLGKQPT
jgi:anti-sigma B factor antagonist